MAEHFEARLAERGQKLKLMRKEYTKQFYKDVSEAMSQNRRLVHMPALGPTELLYSMGFQPVMPENYVTICCAKQMAKPFCETAEERGFSHDLCSYYRCGVGMLYEEDGPFGAMPTPDLVVGSTGLCDPYVKWWETWAKEYGVPFYIFDMPYNLTGELQEHELEWMVSSLKRLAKFVEENKLGKFDYDRFQETVARSIRATELFWQIYELKKAVPCPRGLREVAGDLFYAATSLGRQEAVDYFSLLVEDTRERVEHKIGIIPQEKFRILYDNIPLWYKLQLIDYLRERGAVISVDGYIPPVWLGPYLDGKEIDPEKPWEYLAMRIWSCLQNGGAEVNHKRYGKLVEGWKCEGAILFSNRSCIALTGVVGDKINYLKEKYNIPSISFQADMADPRTFAETEVFAQIDAFLDLLEHQKG
jgi:benzoyl-CoA reductase/2-hydroxyglutaryl-CoA dehydratase subunit BcrC/BadD/HgdB